jgi:hypothetical protein
MVREQIHYFLEVIHPCCALFKRLLKQSYSTHIQVISSLDKEKIWWWLINKVETSYLENLYICYNNNNNIYLLQMGCYPVAVITLHVSSDYCVLINIHILLLKSISLKLWKLDHLQAAVLKAKWGGQFTVCEK